MIEMFRLSENVVLNFFVFVLYTEIRSYLSEDVQIISPNKTAACFHNSLSLYHRSNERSPPA